jgi:hypothetical protein
MSKIQITKKEVETLRFEKGYTIPEMAEHFKVSPTQIKMLLAKLGISTKDRPKKFAFDIVDSDVIKEEVAPNQLELFNTEEVVPTKEEITNSVIAAPNISEGIDVEF